MNTQNYIDRYTSKLSINQRVLNLFLVLGGSFLIALSAQFTFLIAGPTPVTLQTGMVVLIALLFGKKRAVTSVLLYLLEGFSGLPVFAGGVAGMAVLTANFGFLIAFIPLAYIVGMFADSRYSESKVGMFVTLIVANLIVYGLGCFYLGLMFGFSSEIITSACIPFISGDILKMAGAILIAKTINKYGHA